MMDSRNLEYLNAMGIDVWQPRGEQSSDPGANDLQRIVMGEGGGDILCIVETPAQAQLKLAEDIGGAMRCSPIWAWPADGSEGTGELRTVMDAVAEKLLTRVLVFGDRLAAEVLGARVPSVLSAARVHMVPGLERLATDKNAKRTLWRLMLDHGIAAPRKSANATGSSGS
jgi:hypothetical protein